MKTLILLSATFLVAACTVKLGFGLQGLSFRQPFPQFKAARSYNIEKDKAAILDNQRSFEINFNSGDVEKFVDTQFLSFATQSSLYVRKMYSGREELIRFFRSERERRHVSYIKVHSDETAILSEDFAVDRGTVVLTFLDKHHETLNYIQVLKKVGNVWKVLHDVTQERD